MRSAPNFFVNPDLHCNPYLYSLFTEDHFLVCFEKNIQKAPKLLVLLCLSISTLPASGLCVFSQSEMNDYQISVLKMQSQPVHRLGFLHLPYKGKVLN
jgi:hypothetical protein